MSLSNLIDLHSHILPGIDDGPKELKDAVRMVRSAYDSGVRVMVASPHKLPGTYDPPHDDVSQKVEELKGALKEEGIEMQIVQGRESYLSGDLLEYLDSGRSHQITVGDTRYALVEFSLQQIPPFADDLLSKMQFNGLTPIIAHPERYPDVERDPNILVGHIEKGRLLQVNASSLMGRYGKQVKTTAEILTRNRFAHFVSSDMHSPRSITLGDVVDLLVDMVGEREAQRLVKDNPLAVIGNMPIISPTPIRYQPKTGLSRIFSFLRRSKSSD